MTGLPDEDLSDLAALPEIPDRSAGIAELVVDRGRSGAGRGDTARPAGIEAGGSGRVADPVADAQRDPVPVTIYVSPELQRRFERYARRRRRTNAGVVLEAIEARAETLHAVVRAARVSTSPVTGKLFAPSPADMRYLGAGPVQKQAWLTVEQLDVLDGLTQSLGIDRRSSWIAAVLNDFLPGTKERR